MPRESFDTAHEAPDRRPEDTAREDGETASRSPERPETGESGGPKGLEPTRYGDWERNGRCIDF